MTVINETPRHQLGDADQECRYPVLVDGHHLGIIFRWHGAWLATPAGTTDEIRVAAGRIGSEAAARYLVAEFDAGRITPQQATEAPAVAPHDWHGPAPLLHPRMPASPRNLDGAKTAHAGLTEYLWTPLGGYPGADNPWAMRCDLCGWTGVRYWSHLRGRNGNPPSTHRHPGCIEPTQVRARIAAYKK
ncbi:hypothetical protein [Streptomyces sp. NPDC012746]|uniref:hypothetical protein n=1 Tax=Streptomyces sp. NPDC012746 TaxID=3364845 RepID=UPI0036798C2E